MGRGVCTRGRALALLVFLAIVSGWRAIGAAEAIDRSALPTSAKRKIDFRRDIEPILRERCQICHGPDKQTAGLRLDNGADALKGGNSGPVIKPGDSADSKLIHLVSGLNKDLVMPFAGDRLTAEQVGMLRAWIDQGAQWPETPKPAHPSAEAQKLKPKSTHWAFIPPQRPPVPKVRNQTWVRNPIDTFVLAKLEPAGVKPSVESDKVTMIRRLSLDLIGLPPTIEEVDESLADNRDDAYERLVDRLLASPHYGEKWGRHWLDLARYGESDGFEKDGDRPNAWRWRNWVIDAMNSNMPFDEFTIEQIAGDLLPNATVEQKVATGFNRNGMNSRATGIPRVQYLTELATDRVDTFGTAWLGLTLGCARCHDHKFDPIAQREYYQLYAFFNTVRDVDIEAPLPGELGPYLLRKTEYDQKRQELLAEYKIPEFEAQWEKNMLDAAAQAATNPAVRPMWLGSWEIIEWALDLYGGQDLIRLNPSQRTQKQQERIIGHFLQFYSGAMKLEGFKEVKVNELQQKMAQLAKQYPELSEAQVISENPNPPKTHVLIRGDFLNPGVEVQPGVPAVLNPLPPDPTPNRLTLARWVVSRNNPLTARVAVNRMWQEFFGRGIVETSEDFGKQGDPPSHPELLDWLATEFMDNDWNVKHMLKLMVMSATYRQSSDVRPDLQNRDPSNRLLARQIRLRLPAELIRDVTLAASGMLNPAIGGKSMHLPPPAGTAMGPPGLPQMKPPLTADQFRRGLYIFFHRTSPYPQLATFDMPNTLLACSRRRRSATPLQALNLLNDPVFFEAARGLAARTLREKPGSVNDRIDYAFRLCLARPPSPHERDRLAKYYQEQRAILERDSKFSDLMFPAKGVEGVAPAEAAIWVSVSRVLLNLDEFITRE